MAKKASRTTLVDLPPGPIDCACVIHGDVYDWTYVEKLYAMLNRNISRGIKLHVYTEPSRSVPSHMVKHNLVDLGISGPKKSWWYKMQMFNTEHHRGPLLYFDLDVIIARNIDWIWQLPLNYFWYLRDFKHIWRPTHYGINSSVMWWNTTNYGHIWNGFNNQPINQILKKYHGDQDYLSEAILETDRRNFDINRIKSWRWQALDGGYDFRRRCYRTPGSGTILDLDTSILVFHGNPKPDKVQDPLVVHYWQ